MIHSKSSSNDERVTKRKRGVVNEDTYKRNVIRKARIRWRIHELQGYLVSGKSIPDELVCISPPKCGLRFETKIAIWNCFYMLETKNEQDLHLQTLIEAKVAKSRKKKISDDISSCSTWTP